MRLDDSILVTMCCIEVSYDSFMGYEEPWIGAIISGDSAFVTAIEINKRMHGTPTRVGAPITKSAWLVDSAWTISECKDHFMLDIQLRQAFEIPSAYNTLCGSDYTATIQQRCAPILSKYEGSRSGIFAIKRDLDDKKIEIPETDADFFDYLINERKKVKIIRDTMIESVLDQMKVSYLPLL